MKKLGYFLVAITASSIALADGEGWNQHKGSYVELNVGTNAYYLGILSSRGTIGGGGIVGTGWSGALGYNLTNSFALEAISTLPILCSPWEFEYALRYYKIYCALRRSFQFYR